MMRYNVSLFFMIAETPKATNVVCTKHPVTKPSTVAIPYLAPFVTLCISTKILSGPGEIANTADEMINKISVLLSTFTNKKILLKSRI